MKFKLLLKLREFLFKNITAIIIVNCIFNSEKKLFLKMYELPFFLEIAIS